MNETRVYRRQWRRERLFNFIMGWGSRLVIGMRPDIWAVSDGAIEPMKVKLARADVAQASCKHIRATGLGGEEGWSPFHLLCHGMAIARVWQSSMERASLYVGPLSGNEVQDGGTMHGKFLEPCVVFPLGCEHLEDVASIR